MFLHRFVHSVADHRLDGGPVPPALQRIQSKVAQEFSRMSSGAKVVDEQTFVDSRLKAEGLPVGGAQEARMREAFAYYAGAQRELTGDEFLLMMEDQAKSGAPTAMGEDGKAGLSSGEVATLNSGVRAGGPAVVAHQKELNAWLQTPVGQQWAASNPDKIAPNADGIFALAVDGQEGPQLRAVLTGRETVEAAVAATQDAGLAAEDANLKGLLLATGPAVSDELVGFMAHANKLDGYTSATTTQAFKLADGVGARLGGKVDPAALELGVITRDIGKTLIPAEIVNKPGKLTDAEMATMKTYLTASAQLLDAYGASEPAIAGVAAMRERWDGKGYPNQLKGTEIPLAARIVGAIDAYQAMTTARPYRAAKSQDEAIAELVKGSGTQFDPDVVTALVAELKHP